MATAKQTATTERQIKILKTAAQNPIASVEELADDMDEDVSDVESIINEYRLPEEYGANGDKEVPPETGKARVVTVLEDDEDLMEAALSSKTGYRDDVADAVSDRWGEAFTPDVEYISVIVSNYRKERAETTSEQDEQTLPEHPPNSGKERAKAILTYYPDLLDAANLPVSDELADDVSSKVTDQWGVQYTTTKSAVANAVADLSEDGIVRDESDDITGSGFNTRISYECSLCGYSDRNRSTVRKHITNLDDSLHADRNGNEGHLIRVTGDPIEDPETEEGDIDDGFEFLWAVHNNPEAKQSDIADILGVSQTTVQNRINSYGIDWENREEEVEDILGFGEETNDIHTVLGNASYSGPETGLDVAGSVSYLSDVAPETQPERPVEETVSVTLTREEARRFITGDREFTRALRARFYDEALSTFADSH